MYNTLKNVTIPLNAGMRMAICEKHHFLKVSISEDGTRKIQIQDKLCKINSKAHIYMISANRYMMKDIYHSHTNKLL